MRVYEIGEGEPELAVIGSVHGDEPCGKRVIERLLEIENRFQEPVKLVVANEEALEEDTRFLESDLNRSFPGDPESELHEERLASRMLEELEGMRVLDVHSTRSRPVPFLTFKTPDTARLDLLRSTGVERAALFEEDAGTLHEYVEGVIVEVGPQGSDEAEEKAYSIVTNFLKNEGVLEGEGDRSDPEVFRYFETVRGGDWEFLGTNFEKVEEGEVFARAGSTELVTTRRFHPVLMSTDGYEDILGHKAERLGRASELDGEAS